MRKIKYLSFIKNFLFVLVVLNISSPLMASEAYYDCICYLEIEKKNKTELCANNFIKINRETETISAQLDGHSMAFDAKNPTWKDRWYDHYFAEYDDGTNEVSVWFNTYNREFRINAYDNLSQKRFKHFYRCERVN